jgi:hypothetical protein
MMRQTFLICKTLRIGLCPFRIRKAVDAVGNRIATPKAPSIDPIRILSEGTYTSLPQALKEFISNSYDVYATDVALRTLFPFNWGRAEQQRLPFMRFW